LKRLSYSLIVFFLSGLIISLFSENLPLRTVSIKIVADQKIEVGEKWGKWKIDMRQAVNSASRIFNKKFGIKFQIKQYEYWKPEKTRTAFPDLLVDLQKKVTLDECDIVLGLITSDEKRINSSGISCYISGYILVRYLESKYWLRSVLLHELCHIFGASDLMEKGSIMGIEQIGSNFDEFTHRIILLNKQRFFNQNAFPLPEKHLDEAIRLCNQRVALNRSEPGVKLNLVFLYLEKQKPEAALKVYREMLKSNPDIREAYNVLGNIYQRKGEIDLAILEYEKGLEYRLEIPGTHFNLGLAFTRKGWIDRAILEYQRVIELKPDYAKAHANLGYVLLRKGELDRAIEECRIALQICSELHETLCTWAAALLHKRNSLEQALIVRPTEKKYNSDIIKERQGLVEEAISLCHKALSLKDNLPEAYNILGAAYCYQRRISEAEEAFSKALKIKPDFIEAHMNLGGLYFRSQSYEKAAFHVKRIIEINPSSGLGFQILTKIFNYQGDKLLPYKALNNNRHSKKQTKGNASHPPFDRFPILFLSRGMILKIVPPLFSKNLTKNRMKQELHE